MGLSTRMFHSDQAIAEKALELGVSNDFVDVALALASPERAAPSMCM